MRVNVHSGLYYCHGCGEKGSLPKMAQKRLGVPYNVAGAWLSDIDFDAPVATAERHTSAEAAARASAAYDDFTAPPQYALDDRGITAAAAEAYGIRWDNRRRYWVFPVHSEFTGAVEGYEMKSFDRDEDGDTTVLAAPGTVKSKALFGHRLLERGATVILVESPIDAAVFLSAGIPGAVAAFGKGVSAYQLLMLDDIAGHVILALDNDEPGRDAVKKIVEAYDRSRKPGLLGGTREYKFTLSEFAYPEGSDGRDPGDLSDDELVQGVKLARSIRSNAPKAPRTVAIRAA